MHLFSAELQFTARVCYFSSRLESHKRVMHSINTSACNGDGAFVKLSSSVIIQSSRWWQKLIPAEAAFLTSGGAALRN